MREWSLCFGRKRVEFWRSKGRFFGIIKKRLGGQLEREFRVRGDAFKCFKSYTMYCVLCEPNCMNTLPKYTIFRSFWISAQKLPSSKAQAARRCIRLCLNFLHFDMNRLVGMNICQAARHYLRFSWLVVGCRSHWDFWMCSFGEICCVINVIKIMELGSDGAVKTFHLINHG